MDVFDRLDVLAIEAGCTGIAGTKVNCLWYTENKVLVFKLNWSNLETTLHFGFEQIIRSNVTLTDMVLIGFKHHLRAPEPVQPCDVTNKCCNQFGERDEIQAIIDKLSADVAERDEHIKLLGRDVEELEHEMTNIVFILQSDVETKVDDALNVLGVHDEKL